MQEVNNFKERLMDEVNLHKTKITESMEMQI